MYPMSPLHGILMSLHMNWITSPTIFLSHCKLTSEIIFDGESNLIEKTYWFDYFIETEISKCYKMVSCPHGKCIIINIMNFDGHALITRWRSRKNTFWKALLHCWYQLWSYFIPNVGWSSWDCCSRLQGIWRSFFMVMSHKSRGVTILRVDVEDQYSRLVVSI